MADAPANQPPEFAPRDLWADDAALREALAREGAGAFAERVAVYGALAGDVLYALSFDAHRDRPRLRTHDRFGARIDRVEFHPNYHLLMQAAIEHGVAGLSWQEQPAPGAHVARAALSYLHHQVEPGTSCPLTMTHAAIPALRRQPALAEWADKAAAPHYDPSELPIADKPGVTIGMGMTEKQGGSDVRANTTRAVPLEGDDYVLTGHKWFFSAPMSDGFLVLAQAPGGLTCFLLPRRLADGSKNAFTLMRLKDKLGDWSNASSEVEFQGARATRVGEEGRGVATILDMVMLTRLDCMLGSAAEMRMALAHALHHARHRSAFGKLLIDQPLMRNVLADLAIESEAALALSMRVARAVDAAERDPREAALARIGTAIGKYWICKRAPAFVNEAQECLGGAGYVEESILPRLYRQAPLNSIWEGSGNIQCLDVLRALHKEPETAEAFFDALWTGLHPALDVEITRLREWLRAPNEASARTLVERMALALQASVLLQADAAIAPMFVESRLAGAHGLAFGTLRPNDATFEAILARALP
ncbi:acyl-CoA dehydrogenase family protein [Lysobacter sp. A6]|uniref:Acyl-CoA dehydrogenase family protein n=1 Tax=Noviluteimonas lactosilytica TaxID=2888523 RepID=A0ABS8JEM9_9GAMM|nr:acyl-CoA dehydrogenase family protein [Lysobacter lactosilyticus]MCC8362019.1 acyl-CoA dehydrogenase family protein [Lysobacter lactosilyticus]